MPAKVRYSLIDERPLVSVIVPGCNHAEVINQCVESVLASRYLRMEIVLVDGGSTDSTARIMQGLAQQHDRVRFLSDAPAGEGAALARGMDAALGDILVVVEAEAVCASGTLLHLLEGFDHPKVGAVRLLDGTAAFRNEAVREVGGFPPGTPVRVLELAQRVHKAGYRVRSRPAGHSIGEVVHTIT
ncbi:glycosyltransferase [Paenarthrobacter sp. FR1]|uniref:glycosyltransferase n=1 Tax=Paenarthrobacter sp. FR1 TaxID=3439548 RepID=UPI003DA3403D